MNSEEYSPQKRTDEEGVRGTTPRTNGLFWTKILLACLYGFLLTSLPIDEFKDRSNYLEYADTSDIILDRYIDRGLISTLSNEPLWLLVNIFLRTWFESETVLRIIIFLPAFLVAFLALRNQKGGDIFWVILFLFLQPILKNHIVHLRQGAAISVFLLSLSVKSRGLKYLLFSMTPFIHASFFFIVALKMLLKINQFLRFSTNIRLAFAILFGALLAVNLVYVAQSLGARQAIEYDYGVAETSGVGFIFWSTMLMFFVVHTGSFPHRHVFEMSSVGFYLGTYFITEVTARIFESSLMLVLLAGLDLPFKNKSLFLTAVIAYYGLGYFLNRNEPWFGFGFYDLS